MICVKTPLRIPFAGGLSDLKPYCEQFGGATVSATIDQYVYAKIRFHNKEHSVLRYQNQEEHIGIEVQTRC